MQGLVHLHRGRELPQVLHGPEALLIQFQAADGMDGDGDLLQRLLTALRGYNHFFQYLRQQ